MSGHSKWSQIKHQKGAADIKRGQTFTKLSMAISLAVKEGGGNGDPLSNFKLRLAVEKAKAANMPKNNIDRAIDRGLGKGESTSLEEIIYEGYGPGQVAFIIQAATDNRQRTISKLKNLFHESGGILSGQGTVAYMFKSCGLIKARKGNHTDDEYTEIALEAGSSDLEFTDDTILFYTEISDLHKVKEALSLKKVEIADAEIIYKPVTTVKVTEKETAEKIFQLIHNLEAEEDIQKVSANFDIDDGLINSIK